MEHIPLPKLLNQLRDDLLEVQSGSTGKGIRFRVEDIDVELQITATQEAEGGVGVKFWVFNASGNVKGADVRTQKLRLKLKAVEADGTAPEIAGTSSDPSGSA